MLAKVRMPVGSIGKFELKTIGIKSLLHCQHSVCLICMYTIDMNFLCRVKTKWPDAMGRKVWDKIVKPFIDACKRGDEKDEETVKTLLDKSSLLKILNIKDNNQMTGLAWSIDKKKTNITKIILERVFFPNGTIEDAKAKEIAFPYIGALEDAEKVKEILDEATDAMFKSKTPEKRNLLSMLAEINDQNTINVVVSELDDRHILKDQVLDEDCHQWSVLHWACYRNNSVLIRDISTKCSKEVEKQISKVDNKGRTALHVGCREGIDLTSLRYLLGEDEEQEAEEKQQEQRKKEGKERDESTEENGEEPVANTDKKQSLNQKHQVIEIINKLDNDNKSPLHYACEYKHAYLVLELLIQYSKAIALIKRNEIQERKRKRMDVGKKWSALLLQKCNSNRTPFELADRSVMTDLLKEVERGNWDNFEGIPWMTILAQENKFGFYVFEYSGNTDEIVYIFDKLKEHKVRCDKSLCECFPDFYNHFRRSKRFVDLYVHHPLSILGSSGNLALLKHPYIQVYVETAWKSRTQVFFYIYSALYLLFFASLCVYVTTHQFIGAATSNNATNSGLNTTIEYHEYSFQSDFPMLTDFCMGTAAVIAFLGILFEIVRMCILEAYYFENVENIASMMIFPCALLITLVPLVTEYQSWTHCFGCVLIIITAYRGALLLTLVKVWGLGNKLRMLIMGAKHVLFFSPILMFFIVAFAVVFRNLLHKKESFSHMGLAIMKVLIMSVGEIDFNGTFFDSSDHEPFELLAFFILIVFLGIVTISMMNLLIGFAVGDITKLYEEGDQFEFMSKVEHICQLFYVFKMGNLIHKGKIHELREKVQGTSKEVTAQFLRPFEKQYRKYVSKKGMTIEVLSEDIEQQLDVIYAFHEENKVNVEVVMEKQNSMEDHLISFVETKQNDVNQSLIQKVDLLDRKVSELSTHVSGLNKLIVQRFNNLAKDVGTMNTEIKLLKSVSETRK